MTLLAVLRPNSRDDEGQTIEWLQRSGIAAVNTVEELYKIGTIQIQLTNTPEVLSYFSQLDDVLNISRLNDHGILFYLMDVPLWAGVPEGKRMVSETGDGNLFVPMSNVISINTFGEIRPESAKA